MHPSTLAKRGTVLIFVVFIAFYFYGLGHLPLVGPDEPRYAQVAREMFLRHDLIIPTLGGHNWFEKPALLYWMMIVSFKLFGVSEWAARFPAAVSGLLTIAAVYCVGRRLERVDEELIGYGFWSALAAATTIGIIVFSRAASFDIVLTMTTTWALAFYILRELQENTKSRRWLLIGFYVFIGLSLLAKGLAGIVIPLGVAVLYHLLRRRFPDRNAVLSLVWGVPLALLVASTWYAPVIWLHGWTFIDQFFIQHHFARFVSNKYHHWRPVYYYLEIVPLIVLPWTVYFIDGLAQARTQVKNARPLSSDQPGDYLSRVLVFALAWCLFPFLFFSLANSKLPGYILPISPAVALIVGERLWRFCSEPKTNTWPIKTTALLCLLFAGGMVGYAWTARSVSLSLALLIAAPLLVAGIFGLLAPRRPATSVLLLAGAILGVLVVGLWSMAPAAAELKSSKRLLQLADARGYSQTVIYGMQRSDRTPEFYAAGRVVYGKDGEPIMYEGPWQLIGESQKRNDFVLVFVPLNQISQLTGMTSAQADVIGSNGRYALVAVKYQHREP